MIVHLNGKLTPKEQAAISPFDRGFVFGDGIYEGLRAIPWSGAGSGAGKSTRIIGARGHIERMRKGLAIAQINWDPSELERMSLELLEANSMQDAFVYWQTTRGTPAPGEPVRSRVPGPGMRPTVFGYCVPQPSLDSFVDPPRKTCVTVEDRRWLMGHIKAISLIGNVMASLSGAASGAEDAIFVRDGLLGEGLATNVIVVDAKGRMATPSLTSVPILAGVTRTILLEEAPEIEQRAVKASELDGASEVILTGTTTMVTSVTQLDGRAVGNGGGGEPGPAARRLLRVLIEAIRAGRDMHL